MFVSRIPQGLGDPQIRLCEEGHDAPHYAILALSGAQVCVARDEELPDALLHAGQALFKGRQRTAPQGRPNPRQGEEPAELT